MFLIYLAGFGVNLTTKRYEFLRYPALTIKIQRGGDQLLLADPRARRHRSAARQQIIREPEGGSHPGALHPIEAVRGVALEVRQEPP